MWARIEEGRAREFTTEDPTSRFHGELIWVPCPVGTKYDDIWDGSTFTTPPAPPIPVPQSVSILQATLALHAYPGSAPDKTMLDDVNAAVAASTDPRIPLAWSRATSLDRHGLFVTQMAPGLGLTDAALDALFIAAADISV